jgi:DNA-binding beta-propeller fold protein YncE
MGIRYYNFLEVADAATYAIVKSIGPLKNGVRPFTVNSAETLAFTTADGFLGFQVSSLITGQVLYTVPVNGFSIPSGFPATTPSHGISLSPDDKEIYLIDAANSYVHVFDVTGLPATPPIQVADIKVAPISGGEAECAYDCLKDGWLLHSHDGRFVYVGDSGSVIDTFTRTVIAYLLPLANTRKMIEVDFQNGVPVWAANSRSGIGYGASVVTTRTSTTLGSILVGAGSEVVRPVPLLGALIGFNGKDIISILRYILKNSRCGSISRGHISLVHILSLCNSIVLSGT